MAKQQKQHRAAAAAAQTQPTTETKQMNTAVAPKPENTAVSTNVIDFAADAGAGLEGADKESFAIPFLAILQANSPQVDTIEGAKAGMFFNTVTNELYSNPRIIPCAYQRRWVRWGAREAGGGFKGEYTPAQANEIRERGEIKELDNRMYFPETDGSVNPKKSDRLSDTRNHYVLIVDGTNADYGTPAVLALASTGVKVSKNFMSRIDSKKIKVGASIVTAPSFSGVYEITTTKKTNEKGSWWQPDIAPLGDVQSASLYAQAKEFHSHVTSGRVKVAHETAVEPDGGSAGGGASGDDGAF